MLEAAGPQPDGYLTVQLAAPGQVNLAFDCSGGAAMQGYFTDCFETKISVDSVVNGGFEGVVVNATQAFPTALFWTIGKAGSTFTLYTDGVAYLSFTNTKYANGIFGFKPFNTATSPLSIADVFYQTPAQFSPAAFTTAIKATALANATAKIGTPTSAGVYGEAPPADNLPRGIYGPTQLDLPYSMFDNFVVANYFVRGMSGVTRMTVASANLYAAVDNQVKTTNWYNDHYVAKTATATITFDNSLSGGTDSLSINVTLTARDPASLSSHTAGCFFVDGQPEYYINAGFALDGAGPGDQAASYGVTGADAGLFGIDYNGLYLTPAATPLSSHYGRHTLGFTHFGVATASNDIYILGPQHPRAKINFPGQVYDTALSGDTLFNVAASSELGGFVFTVLGDVTAYVTVDTAGVARLKTGVSLSGKTGQTVSGVIIVASHGTQVVLPVAMPVLAGTVLPASNMTAVVAADLKNWAADPNNNRRRAVTPSVTGMPAGTVTWSLQQNNTNADDANPTNPYGLGHNRYVQNADGSVDALAHLSTQTDTLTLIARGASGTVCTQSFDVVVTSVPETAVYVGRGMAALHGSVGYEKIGQAISAQIRSTYVNPHFYVMGDDDPHYYDNDWGDTYYSQGIAGPSTWEGVPNANGRYPRVGGFWQSGKFGGVNGSAQYADGKGFMLLGNGDHIIKNIEFSNVNGCGTPGSNTGSGGNAIRKDGDTRGNLWVDNCFFHDCDQPIESGGTTGNVTITRCTIQNSSGAYQGAGAMHGSYIAAWKLTVDHCLYHLVFNGHLLKARVEFFEITNNRFFDGARGGASSQIDICDGGQGTVANSVLHKFRGQNGYIVQFAEEMRISPHLRPNILNSHDNIFINNMPDSIPSLAISANHAVDPVSNAQTVVNSVNDSFYGGTGGHGTVQFTYSGYTPDYNFGMLPYSALDPSMVWVPNIVNPTLLTTQPALDFTPAHSFQGWANVAAPGPSLYPYDGESHANWPNMTGVQVLPAKQELSVSASAAGTVLDVPTLYGNRLAENNPTQPDPGINPFADGNNTWRLRTDFGSYAGGVPYVFAPAGRFTINPSTGALTYNGGSTAGTTEYVGRECKNNTNGTVVTSYEYIRVTA